jgi:uncharacterized membrane protein
MTLESSKTLGGIGAILLVVAVVAFFAQPFLSLMGIVGAILLLIAMHSLADYYREKAIFNNALYAFIALIVGIIVTFASFFYLVVYTSYLTDLISLLYPGFNGDWSNLPNLTPNTNVNPADLVSFVGPILSILAAAWIFAIIASFFAWRSLKRVASKSTVGLFSTAGLLLLIGAVLIIAFGLGAILMWIAVLLLAIAFFQIKPQIEQPVAASQYPPPTST